MATKFSLRTALTTLWALVLALCLALAFLMYSLVEQGASAQLRQGREKLALAADDAARRYDRYRTTFADRPPPLDDPQTRADLEAMLSVAFTGQPGVEGGFWRGRDDSLAYSFPTHDGPRQKRDLPQAELPQIEQAIHDSQVAQAPLDRRYNGENVSILLHATPLPGPPPDLAVWTMTRVPLNIGQSYGWLGIGLGALLLLALGSGLWLLRSLRRWTGRLSTLEESIAATPLEDLPPLAPTGERELDRIVAAFNRLNDRLKTSREDSARMGRDLARSDRLAALGRMAAGLAHEIIGPAAPSDATVLVQGETGTGKEEVARAPHRHGPRADRPFVAVNCAAMPAELLESELFGHVKGAFTGALNQRTGRFSEANRGTLFLDEIGDMTLPMQAKILRVLQDRIVTPVGGTSPVPVDVRIVAATHRDLIGMVRDGKFREDLFYRLSVVGVTLPPLRERGADILVLAEHFLRQLAPAGQPARRLSLTASQALLAHGWPGNVRELRNAVQNATVTVRGPVIDRGDLPLGSVASPGTAADALDTLLDLPWNEAVARLEKALLTQALRAAGGNRTEAARRLDIHRQLLYAKLREHGLGEGASKTDDPAAG